jgi:hypothetical protein
MKRKLGKNVHIWKANLKEKTKEHLNKIIVVEH